MIPGLMINIISILLISSFEKDKTTQLIYDTLIDVDNNIYKTINIGTKIWIAENLKTTRFNDGTDIQLVTNNAEWAGLMTSGYCWFKNDEATNKNVYGALYNWYAVNTGKLCPKGWHVPSNDEWMTLAEYVNGNVGKLKGVGTPNWAFPITPAKNEIGFSARLGGFRYHNGVYYSINKTAFWWSASECTECYEFPEWDFNDAWDFSITGYPWGYGNQHDNMLCGYSVRCIKN